MKRMVRMSRDRAVRPRNDLPSLSGYFIGTCGVRGKLDALMGTSGRVGRRAPADVRASDGCDGAYEDGRGERGRGRWLDGLDGLGRVL